MRGGNPTPQPSTQNTNRICNCRDKFGTRDCGTRDWLKPILPLASAPKEFLGGNAEGVTPVPIPNTEVKPLRADGTARAAAWESRSPPGIISKAPPVARLAGLCCFLSRLFCCKPRYSTIIACYAHSSPTGNSMMNLDPLGKLSLTRMNP